MMCYIFRLLLMALFVIDSANLSCDLDSLKNDLLLATMKKTKNEGLKVSGIFSNGEQYGWIELKHGLESKFVLAPGKWLITAKNCAKNNSQAKIKITKDGKWKLLETKNIDSCEFFIYEVKEPGVIYINVIYEKGDKNYGLAVLHYIRE